MVISELLQEEERRGQTIVVVRGAVKFRTATNLTLKNSNLSSSIYFSIQKKTANSVGWKNRAAKREQPGTGNRRGHTPALAASLT